MKTLLCWTIYRLAPLLLPLVLTLIPSSALSAPDPELNLGRPEIHDGKVVLDVQLRGFFKRETLGSLESGVPATLVFQWCLYRERIGWRDQMVREGEIRNRIFFDVLEEQYHLFNHQGRPLGACDAISGLREVLCRREAMVLATASGLLENERYYVEMIASLEILSDEQVRGFEGWLLGERDTGAATFDLEVEEVEGLSSLVLGVVKRIAGLGATTAKDESPVFSVSGP